MGDRYDFFLSRRGSVATIAREVTDVLTEKGYKVNVEDYDFRPGASFVEAMHEGLKNSRDLLILYTSDYETSFYTRKEFTSFVAEQALNSDRHIIVLRCEDVPPRALLAGLPFQDLVDVNDPEERKRRINNLAFLLSAQGDLSRARQLYERALAYAKSGWAPSTRKRRRSSATSPRYSRPKATS